MKTLSLDTYEEGRTAAAKAIAKAAKGTDNEILDSIQREDDPKQRVMREKHCRIIEKIMYEGLKCYRESDMSFKETIEELCEALEAVKKE